MSITQYANLITSQHIVQPNFNAWLAAALNIVNDDMTMTTGLPSNFDIDAAVGIQLDLIGVLVGRSRILNFQLADGSSPILDDAHYLLALKAKIAQNQWDGTIPQIYNIWNSLLPNNALQIIDNQDMTMVASISGQLDIVTTEMIAAKYIIPKPMGVGISILGVSTAAGTQYMGILVSGWDSITVSTSP